MAERSAGDQGGSTCPTTRSSPTAIRLMAGWLRRCKRASSVWLDRGTAPVRSGCFATRPDWRSTRTCGARSRPRSTTRRTSCCWRHRPRPARPGSTARSTTGSRPSRPSASSQCSPRAAGRGTKLAETSPKGANAVPAALRGRFEGEPRYLDLRWARNEDQLDLRHSRFREAIAELAAPIHGMAKDELESEDVRRHRRGMRLARAAVARARSCSRSPRRSPRCSPSGVRRVRTSRRTEPDSRPRRLVRPRRPRVAARPRPSRPATPRRGGAAGPLVRSGRRSEPPTRREPPRLPQPTNGIVLRWPRRTRARGRERSDRRSRSHRGGSPGRGVRQDRGDGGSTGEDLRSGS